MFRRAQWTVLLAISMTQACKSSSDYCPGACPVESPYPTMTVETADGRAAIAQAKVVSGPCVHLLIHSAGEAGVPESYAAVQMTYNGDLNLRPLCLLEVTSVQGEVVVVTGEILKPTYHQTCCPTGRCCAQKTAVSSIPHVEFKEPHQTVPFILPLDGGAGPEVDAGAVDAGTVDAGAVDAGTAFDANIVDAGEIDAPAVDASTLLDGDSVDAAVDEAIDD